VRHFAVEAKHLRAPLPVIGMENLLRDRLVALRVQVAERFRQARATGTVANVKLLSAAIRATKAQLTRAGDG
jgi:hypothetical protein